MIFSVVLRSSFVCVLFAGVSLTFAQQYPQQYAPPQYNSPYRVAMNPETNSYPTSINSAPTPNFSVPPSIPASPAPPVAAQMQAPFMLDARQQSDLDLFLKRWEEFSGKIKRFEIGFTTYNNNLGETPFSTYGSFNYIAPDKMSLHIQGEWLSKTERKDGSRQEKLIADGRAIYVYDFSKKVVKEMPLPPEMQGKTISTGPLPLVFGAKADDMKSRYWLRLVTPEAAANTQVWLEVFPRWAEDAAEFQRVILAVNKDTMIPAGMKVVDVNAKSYVDYAFDAKSCKINNRLDEIASVWRDLFTEVPLGWKREIVSQNVPGNNVANNSAPSPQESSNAPKTVNLYSP